MRAKHVYIICLYLIFSGDLSAQLRLGPIGGMNFNRQIFKSNTYRYDALFRNRYGFNIGAISDLVLTKNLSMQSEFLFSLRGGFFKTDKINISEEYSSSVGYINIPVCLTYKVDVNKAYLIAGAGPYIGKLLSTSHRYYSDGNNIENGKLRVGLNTETDQIKPWDFGVKVKAGFELKKGMYLVAFYDIGAYDINPQFVVTRNKTYGFQLGYIFSLTEEDRYNRFENFYEF
ncbi:MAG: porin family protein [Chitinophagaceae bacterium]